MFWPPDYPLKKKLARGWIYLTIPGLKLPHLPKQHFLLFQMNSTSEEMAMDSEVPQNESLIRFASPILNKSDISNMTIIQTGNGTIVAHDIFLNTTAAQALSGIFVWSALLLTCHQVGYVISVVCLCTCFWCESRKQKAWLQALSVSLSF